MRVVFCVLCVRVVGIDLVVVFEKSIFSVYLYFLIGCKIKYNVFFLVWFILIWSFFILICMFVCLFERERER